MTLSQININMTIAVMAVLMDIIGGIQQIIVSNKVVVLTPMGYNYIGGMSITHV